MRRFDFGCLEGWWTSERGEKDGEWKDSLKNKWKINFDDLLSEFHEFSRIRFRVVKISGGLQKSVKFVGISREIVATNAFWAFRKNNNFSCAKIWWPSWPYLENTEPPRQKPPGTNLALGFLFRCLSRRLPAVCCSSDFIGAFYHRNWTRFTVWKACTDKSRRVVNYNSIAQTCIHWYSR